MRGFLFDEQVDQVARCARPNGATRQSCRPDMAVEGEELATTLAREEVLEHGVF